MNDPQALPGEASDPVEGAAEAAPAPKRRRTRVAAAADTVSAPVVEAAPAAVEAAPKPAAKRRTRKAASETPSDAAVADVSVAAVVVPAAEPLAPVAPEVTPAPRARRTRKPVEVSAPLAEAAAQLSLEMPAPEVAPDPAPVVTAVAETGEPVVQADDRGPRSERRDRRDRQRGRRSEQGESTPQAQAPARFQAADADADDEGDDDGVAVAAVPVPVASVAQRFEEVISGAYDAQAELAPEEEEEVGKRVLRPEPEAPKLHKVLAQAGIGSRRDMEQAITDGAVTVNGEVAHLGMRITFGDQIRVSGKPVKVRIAPAPARVLAYHKPVGEVVTHNDPEGRPTVFKRLPRLQQGKWLSVGRLDLNTEGLLLFTNSGDLAHQLMHPRFGVEREYAVRVLGDLSQDARDQLLAGVEIEGQSAAFKSIEDGGGEGANHWWRVTIAEGRNREVRKLFDAVGLTVSRLIRIRYGSVVLPRGLKRGVWVELDDHDVRLIRQLAGGERRQGQGQGPQGQKQGQGPGQGQGQGPQGPGQGQGKNRKNRNGRQGGGAPQFGQGSNFNGGPPQQQGPQGRRGPGGQGGQGGNPQQRPPKPPRPSRDESNPESDEPMFIPNPLEQTFDRRFATGSKRISAGFGRPSDDDHRPQQKKGGPREPDPMQTSVGYIGADAYFRKPGGGGGGGGNGGGQRRRGRR